MIKIEGAGYPLKEIFSDRFFFNIPNYQRPYVWTTEQAEKLLDDLIDVLGDTLTEKNPKVQEITPYFLGNIVLIKGNTTNSEVIDGQQRLTTLTILLALLRELLPSLNLDKYICQPEDEVEGLPARPRLYLRHRDQDFFRKYIQNLDGLTKLKSLNLTKIPDSQKNIAENAIKLQERLLNTEQFPNQECYKRLVQFIVQQCYLVVVSTPNFDSAYRIFSVLNDRGMNLSTTDILKADLLGKISEQTLDSPEQREKAEHKYTQKWENLEYNLGREGFSELFSHIRMIYKKTKLSKSVLEEFRKYVLDDITDPLYFIDEVLEPYAEAFVEVKRQSYENYQNGKNGNDFINQINQLLKWLKRIDHSDWIPPALFYLKNNGHSPEILLKFFTYLERLAVGLMVQKSNINYRIKRYANLLKFIEDKKEFEQDSPLFLTQSEQQEIVDTLSKNLYLMPKISRYVLMRLDTILSDGIPDYESHKSITIEHILPQNPKANSQWQKWFTDEEREKYVHCLGNLVLLSGSKNSEAGNYEFITKKDKYFFSNKKTTIFSLTMGVSKEQEWTPAIIEKRQKELIDVLKQVWQLQA